MDAYTIDPGKARYQTLRALRDMTNETGFPPSLTELGNKRELSVPGVKKHLDWLERNGLVSKPKSQPRSCVITDAGRMVLRNRRG